MNRQVLRICVYIAVSIILALPATILARPDEPKFRIFSPGNKFVYLLIQ